MTFRLTDDTVSGPRATHVRRDTDGLGRTEGTRQGNQRSRRDVAALIKRGNDLRREADELNRTADELSTRAARLKEDTAKQKRLTQQGPR